MPLNFWTKAVAAVMVLAGTGVGAQAAVTYGTTGVFGNGLNTTSSGGMTITYNPISAGTTASSPGIVSLGTFNASGSSSGTFNTTFTLTINQDAPTAGSADFGSWTVSGTLSGSSSSATLVFGATTSVTIGSSKYALMSTDFGGGQKGIALLPSSVNGGNTTLQASVTNVPEPGSLALLGMAAGGLLLRRRK